MKKHTLCTIVLILLLIVVAGCDQSPQDIIGSMLPAPVKGVIDMVLQILPLPGAPASPPVTTPPPGGQVPDPEPQPQNPGQVPPEQPPEQPGLPQPPEPQLPAQGGCCTCTSTLEGFFCVAQGEHGVQFPVAGQDECSSDACETAKTGCKLGGATPPGCSRQVRDDGTDGTVGFSQTTCIFKCW
ncbi:hypothetical protein COY95_00060 [Candidatus Woesearchaeota archaeon CG_4_10_14_0_8_um_filter_47_5]|nr:MAG: hypothetical protein COY95_00060 [Candidatus Woesearchaeota archaeon CG_4_10_14_0_8_um_filter_47_5]